MRLLEGQLESLRAAQKDRVDTLDRLSRAVPWSALVQQYLHADARFETRERRSQAEVDAKPEGDVSIGVAAHIEPIRVGKYALVAIGRRKQRHHHRTHRYRSVTKLNVSGGEAKEPLHRCVIAQSFFDQTGDQLVVMAHKFELLGM